jgi:hypothetical protein
LCPVSFCLLTWASIAVQPDLGFWERLCEQAESGHSVLTPEQRAFFATPADPLVLDGPLVYGSMPEHNTT